jgi:hypothetical protein
LVNIINSATYNIGYNNFVLFAIVTVLFYVLFALATCITALIALAYWDHFMNILYFDSTD